MSVLGIISEYNPFHLGHKYHIDVSKKETGSNYVISIMSGSFVQRGEPAFLDKWSRAKMAIEGGVDLVIELPFIYSSQTAEVFAFGGVKLMDSLNIVDYISFGSEAGSLDKLYDLVNTILEEPPSYKSSLKNYLFLGYSFPIARERALIDYYNDESISSLITSPNNILAIEYLKSLKLIGSKIEPFTIERIGEGYSSNNLSNISSATGIRNSIVTNGLKSVESLLPLESFKELRRFFLLNKNFNKLANYEDILLYLLRTKEEDYISNLIGSKDGLGNRLISISKSKSDIESIINSSVSKSHTRTRVKRLLVHLLLDLNEATFNKLDSIYPSYIRVLASNQKGLDLIREINKKSTLPVITKFANYQKLNSNNINDIIHFDKKSTDIFFLGLDNKLMNKDFLTSPYIKK